MEEVIGGYLGRITDNFGMIRNFLRFLDIPSDNRADLKINKTEGISVENVTFKYPNAEKDSLKNINLTINPGEIIAIVGENGAGKNHARQTSNGFV